MDSDMKSIRLVFGALLAVVCVVSHSNRSWADGVPGARVYDQHCGRCHNFRPPTERNDKEWSVITAHMRSVGQMTGTQTRAVLEFLRSSNNPVTERPVIERKASSESSTAEGASADRGKLLVEKYQCAGCHVIEGKGGAVGPSLDTAVRHKGEDYVRGKIANPKLQNPSSVMPPYALSEAELQSIVSYLRRIEIKGEAK